MIHHLQRGKKRIEFQCTPEHAELDGITVGEVNAGVAASRALFDMLQHLMGLVTVAVSRRPLIHLALRPAREPQQLSPVAFYEEQHTRNSAVLGIIGISESLAGHMDVQAAGACLMGQVTLCDSLVQHLIPRHFVELVLQ